MLGNLFLENLIWWFSFLLKDVADTEGGYTFECQHGPDECYGNKVLACGQQYITNHNTFLEFNFCVMGAEDPPSSGEEVFAFYNSSVNRVALI